MWFMLKKVFFFFRTLMSDMICMRFHELSVDGVKKSVINSVLCALRSLLQRCPYGNVYISQRDAQILVNNLYFSLMSLHVSDYH